MPQTRCPFDTVINVLTDKKFEGIAHHHCVSRIEERTFELDEDDMLLSNASRSDFDLLIPALLDHGDEQGHLFPRSSSDAHSGRIS